MLRKCKELAIEVSGLAEVETVVIPNNVLAFPMNLFAGSEK